MRVVTVVRGHKKGTWGVLVGEYGVTAKRKKDDAVQEDARWAAVRRTGRKREKRRWVEGQQQAVGERRGEVSSRSRYPQAGKVR